MAPAGEAHSLENSRSREKLLLVCSWGVHAYTALGGVLGLLTLEFAAQHRFRAAFLALAIATAVDSTDGPMARALEVRRRIPFFDGATLDNVVDYLTYVLAPVFLMLRAALLPAGNAGFIVGSLAVVASAYGLCRTDAKTDDNYFLGFPSYWNLVAFYLFCFRLTPAINAAIVAVLAVQVFVPIKYIYPNRTKPLRPLTISLGVIWAITSVTILMQLPAPNRVLLAVSFSYVVYYFVVSFILHYRIVTARAQALN